MFSFSDVISLFFNALAYGLIAGLIFHFFRSFIFRH